MKKIFTTAASILALASAANASDLRGSIKDPVFTGPVSVIDDWRGFGVAVGVGGTFANTEIETYGGSIDGIGSDGVEAAASAWYYMQSGQFVFGPAIEGRIGNVETELGSASLEVDYRLMGAFHAGIAHGNTLIYLLGGAEVANVAIDAVNYDDDIWGWTVGGGIKHRRDGGMVIGLEARYTDFEDQDLDCLTLNPESLTATVSLGYQF